MELPIVSTISLDEVVTAVWTCCGAAHLLGVDVILRVSSNVLVYRFKIVKELLNGLHVAVGWMRKLRLLFAFPEEDNIESPVVQHVQLNLHDGKHSNALYFLSMFDPLQCSQSEVCSEHTLIRKCLS